MLATIYRVMGVDLETHFINRAGRPVSINNYGAPIKQLLG